jgi:hypothetical protein
VLDVLVIIVMVVSLLKPCVLSYSSDFWLLAKSYARRFEDRYRKIRQEFDVGEDVVDEEGGHDDDNNDDDDDNNSTTTNNNNIKRTSSGTKIPKGSVSAASNVSDVKYSSVVKPPLDARAQFGSNLFLLSGMELGYVLSTCEEECPECLENVRGGKDCHIEINVDLIPITVFELLNTYVSGKVGGGTGGAKSVTNSTSTNSRSGSPNTILEKKGPGRPKKKHKKEKE